MKATKEQVTFSPIGEVTMEGNRYLVKLNAPYGEGLQELEGFSHLQVVWWGNQYDTPESREILITDRPYTEGPEKVGIFATRAPVRPNPVLISVVGVISIDPENGTIEVPYIDAEPGTPVLDIKPYHPSSDRVKDVRVPEYMKEWPKWLEDSACFDWSRVFNF